MSNETDIVIIQRYHFITQQVTIYAGISVHTLCLFGTIMNIITFSQSIFRRRPASFYLLYASVFDLLHLSPKSILNILQDGFYYDWTMKSTFLCQIKLYLIYVFTIISCTLTLLACIDRYLLSSNNSKIWNFSTRSIAKRSIKLTIIFWLIASIPIIFCTKHINDKKMICSNLSDNRFCLFIRFLYTCLLDGFIPPFLMMIFGLMTYKNVHRLYRRSRTRSIPIRKINYQITSMLILQSIKSTFASFPYSIFNSYLLITKKLNKSLLQEAKENLIMEIVYSLFWSNYTSFFIYIYSSDIFRKQWIKGMKYLICCCCCYHKTRH